MGVYAQMNLCRSEVGFIFVVMFRLCFVTVVNEYGIDFMALIFTCISIVIDSIAFFHEFWRLQ